MITLADLINHLELKKCAWMRKSLKALLMLNLSLWYDVVFFLCVIIYELIFFIFLFVHCNVSKTVTYLVFLIQLKIINSLPF